MLGLAVLAFLAGPPRVSAGLADRVGATFELMAPEFVKAFEMRIEEVLSLPDRAVQHAKDFDVAMWVVPDVTWVSAVTGAALFWRREPLLPGTAVEEQRFPWEPPASE